MSSITDNIMHNFKKKGQLTFIVGGTVVFRVEGLGLKWSYFTFAAHFSCIVLQNETVLALCSETN